MKRKNVFPVFIGLVLGAIILAVSGIIVAVVEWMVR